MALLNKVKTLVLTVLAVFSFGYLFAGHHDEDAENKEHHPTDFVEKEHKFHVASFIMDHIGDAHQWHLWGDHHHGTSIYLPVILMDGGLKMFSSSHLYHGSEGHAVEMIVDTVKTAHGEEIIETEKSYHYVVGEGAAAGYAIYKEEIYKLENGKLTFEKGFPVNDKPGDFSITKNVMALFVGALIVLLLMLSVARYYRRNGAVAPKGLAKFIEPLIIFVRDDIAKANIDEHKYKRYVPYLLTIFFFIWVNNLMGLIPFFPGGANLTGNIAVTMFLAVCTLLVTVFSGNKHYWKHIFATPGVPIPLLLIMIPIELVGILTKPFALMIRLFANITAGHVIILAFISIIFINKNMAWGAMSVPMALFISVLELLVAALQAYLFAMLSALFIGAAVEEAHH